jgi:hypothetical protein
LGSAVATATRPSLARAHFLRQVAAASRPGRLFLHAFGLLRGLHRLQLGDHGTGFRVLQRLHQDFDLRAADFGAARFR